MSMKLAEPLSSQPPRSSRSSTAVFRFGGIVNRWL
jgi:hypothetical protein